MARDAAESEVLVVASKTVDQSQAPVMRWLYSLLGWRTDRRLPYLLIGLFERKQIPATESDWLVDQLTAFTERNGFEFVWRSESGDLEDGNWFDRLAERLLGLASG